jgi:Septum formation
MAAEPEPAGAGDEITTGVPPLPADLLTPHDAPAGKRAGRGKLMWISLVGVGLLASLGVIFAATNSWTSSTSSTSPTRRLTEDQLRSGDCLQGSDLVLGSGNFFQWPHFVTAVPCAQQHYAEVFFASNIWPQSLVFPGENAITHQGYVRCLSAFRAYDGIAPSGSTFTIDYIIPGKTAWASGDRRVICVAYEPWAPVDYSLKGSHRLSVSRAVIIKPELAQFSAQAGWRG